MESLALLVVFIILSVIFFAGFTGFIIGDNVESKLIIYALGIIPGVITAVIFVQPLAVALWAVSYLLGFQLGRFLR